jgi:hypothetical protein
LRDGQITSAIFDIVEEFSAGTGKINKKEEVKE